MDLSDIDHTITQTPKVSAASATTTPFHSRLRPPSQRKKLPASTVDSSVDENAASSSQAVGTIGKDTANGCDIKEPLQLQKENSDGNENSRVDPNVPSSKRKLASLSPPAAAKKAIASNLEAVSSSSSSRLPVIPNFKKRTSPRLAAASKSKKGASEQNTASLNKNNFVAKGALAALAERKGSISSVTSNGSANGNDSIGSTHSGRQSSNSSKGVASSRGKATSNSSPVNLPPSAAAGAKRAAPVESELESRKKKRAAWDVKGRLQDMEEMHEILLKEVRASSSAYVEKNERVFDLEGRIDVLENEKKTLSLKIETLEREKATVSIDSTRQKAEHEIEARGLRKELEQLRKELSSKEEELSLARSEVITLKTALQQQAAESVIAESERRTLKIKVEELESKSAAKDAIVALKADEAQKMAETIKTLEQKLMNAEVVRRKLHNALQELKGNIRVFCRVRPVLESERNGKKPEDLSSFISFPGSNGNECNEIDVLQPQQNSSQKSQFKNNHFAFDKVFKPDSTQAQVFSEIADLVQSVLDGYRVCLFAYGQTGAGKTWTMEGPPPPTGDAASIEKYLNDQGMIPRAVSQIFSTADQLCEQGWKFTVEVSLLEIYNETLRDLLVDSAESKKHEIKHINGSTVVTDLKIVTVSSPEEVYEHLKTATKNRAVAATLCNDRSSRSHCVFTLKVTGQNAASGELREGLLNLIDLAGSERLSSSGSAGERLKETQAINKSLSSLGDVIFALANREAHVPYRNGKLTYLLQNSLGGESKVLMFVNISSCPDHVQETLCSLRFATKVNSCQIGTARRHVK